MSDYNMEEKNVEGVGSERESWRDRSLGSQLITEKYTGRYVILNLIQSLILQDDKTVVQRF